MTFLPFTQPHIDEDTIRGVAEVLRSGWMASGPQVLKFESALGEYLHGRPVRVMTSATAALEIALRVAGVDRESEVILPAMSFAATSFAVWIPSQAASTVTISRGILTTPVNGCSTVPFSIRM